MAQAQDTAVYRYYDPYGILIYVGITSRGILRQREHNADKAWWPFVARQEVDHHPTREDALAAEVQLIRLHQPPFNHRHNPAQDAALEAYALIPERPGDPLDAFHALPHRRLRLQHVPDRPHLTFRTEVQDVALAVGLHARPVPTRVREWHGPFQTRVTGVHQAGTFALVICAKQRPETFRFAEAVLRWDSKLGAAWIQSVQVAR